MTKIFVNSKFEYRNLCLQQVIEVNSDKASGQVKMKEFLNLIP